MAAFDPSKFLAETTPVAGFNPDKFLADTVPHYDGADDGVDDGSPSAVESALHGAGHGALLGFGDEINGAIQAVGDKLRGEQGTLGDRYRYNRDAFRREEEKNKAANPSAYMVGNMVGGLAPTTLAGSAGAGLKGLTTMGAAMGAGDSDADLTKGETGRAALDTGIGAAEGLAGLFAGRMVGGALSKISPRIAALLDRAAVASGRRAVTGAANSLSSKAALPGSAVMRMVDEGAIRPFDTTQQIAERINGPTVEGAAGGEERAGLRGAAGREYENIVRGLQREGVKGPNAMNLAQHLVNEGSRIGDRSLGTGVPEMYASQAKELLGKTTDETGNLALDQAEDIKRSLQSSARNEYGRLGGNGMAGDAKMAQAATVKDAIENEVAMAAQVAGPNTPINDLAQQFVPAKERAGDYISAGYAAAKGAARAQSRAAFGPIAQLGALGSVVSGHPVGLAAAVGQHVLRTRGASTTAVAARSLSRSIGAVGAAAASNPQALGKFAGIVTRSLNPQAGGGKSQFAAVHYVLSSDPHYQAMQAALPDVNPHPIKTSTDVQEPSLDRMASLGFNTRDEQNGQR